MMCEISRHGNVRTSVFGIKILSVSRVSLPHLKVESFQEEKYSENADLTLEFPRKELNSPLLATFGKQRC